MKEFDFEKIPIVEIANEILLDGVKKGASDIHFDPSKEDLKIRMRVDGTLYDYSVVPGEYKRNMVSRIKMIASMNIMETRLPQDGAIKSKIGDRMLDLRVSSLPTNCGEKVVLRILDYSKSLQGLESLGFSAVNLEKILKMIAIPNGIVLVTGATGSGKSTTVYSILSRLNTREVNIITVEDPVEMDVNGINQVQAQQEIGLDFAAVLRSILRQDPDIIMIGEIRDSETAKIAVRASITGHKVLSTIHTNSALNTIERLTDMEVERYLIGTSLNGCISQKLAKKLCPHCRKERAPSDYEQSLFEKVLHTRIEKIYDTNEDGCENCMKGFKGRICLAEVLLIGDEVRTAITNNAPKEEMRRLVYGKGSTHTLLEDGLEKVALGETSFDEVLKLVDLENDLAIHNDLNEQGIEFKPFDVESAMPKKAEAPNPAPVSQPVQTPNPTPAPTAAPVQKVAPVQSVQPVQPVVVQAPAPVQSVAPVQPVQPVVVQAPAPVQPIAPQPVAPVQTQQQIQQQLSESPIDVTNLIPHN
ncbi:MAG: Flp pilus assembly complex ATPase component TadA [Bacilli bacterium]|nr:Flp pilus assembly complex ATPase component TadA [Bacilli bacterium]